MTKQVLGIVTERDILRAMLQGQDGAQAITSLMSSPVHTVSEEMDFRQAYRSAAVRGIRHLVVTDRQGKPLGVVTETDFHRRLGLEFFSQLNTVDTLMEHDFPRLPADATLDSALAAMAQMRQSCVVVIADESPHRHRHRARCGSPLPRYGRQYNARRGNDLAGRQRADRLGDQRCRRTDART
jgi:CBS domain-containing protein